MLETTKKANPAPLGLVGFGMTTILLNLHNVGLTKLTIMIAAMGLTIGGISQIIAGILEFKNNNTFGSTAFIAYGFFWLSLVLIWCNPLGMTSADHISVGFYLLVWGLFTAFMFIAALKHNFITKLIFGSLTILFLLLAVGDFTEVEWITKMAGSVGIICGLSALYSAVAQIVNNEHGRNVFPL